MKKTRDCVTHKRDIKSILSKNILPNNNKAQTVNQKRNCNADSKDDSEEMPNIYKQETHKEPVFQPKCSLKVCIGPKCLKHCRTL